MLAGKWFEKIEAYPNGSGEIFSSHLPPTDYGRSALLISDFGFNGLKGRLMSSSYAPEPGNPRHAPMIAARQKLFDAHQSDGQVTFDYDTIIFFGKLE